MLVATAAQRDVPIYLEGLGTVAAFKTVTVRSQVDGRLDKVLFKEGPGGQEAASVLAQIDPRPFADRSSTRPQAALARDTAQLDDAQLNLERYEALREQQPRRRSSRSTISAALVGQLEGAVADRPGADRERAAATSTTRASRRRIDGVTGVRLVDAGNLVHADRRRPASS